MPSRRGRVSMLGMRNGAYSALSVCDTILNSWMGVDGGRYRVGRFQRGPYGRGHRPCDSGVSEARSARVGCA